MMRRARLPLPEVIELPDMPPEFAGRARGEARVRPKTARKPRRQVAVPIDRVEVWHLEDPRASIFALFS